MELFKCRGAQEDFQFSAEDSVKVGAAVQLLDVGVKVVGGFVF